jgi:hypothetical protein
MRAKTWLGAVALSLLTLASAAFEYPVRDYSVREAYFLGRRKDEKTAQFLARYVQRFPLPKSGPHVAEVEFRTPFEQIVLRARNAPDGYSSQRAAQEYRAQAERVVVRVLIYLTPTYPAHTPIHILIYEPIELRPEDFWREFDIRVNQKDDEVAPRRISGKPIYTTADVGGLPGLIGAEVELEFDAADFSPEPARVEILAPDGQRVRAVFDLEKLR